MPRVSRQQMDQNRASIEEVSARLFREQGLNGISVADLMAAAGLTHGGFYGHFESKDALAAVACGKAFEQSLGRWERSVQRQPTPQRALEQIIERYLSPQSRDQPGRSCPAVALAADVAREAPGKPVRAAYLDGVKGMAEALTTLAAGAHLRPHPRQQALLQLATMVGALSLARATRGDPLSDEILAAVRALLLHEPLPPTSAEALPG